QLEHVLNVHDMLPSLLEMLLETGAELFVPDLADQLRKRLVGEGALHVEDVAELVQQKLADRCDLGHACSFLDGRNRPRPAGPWSSRRLAGGRASALRT